MSSDGEACKTQRLRCSSVLQPSRNKSQERLGVLKGPRDILYYTFWVLYVHLTSPGLHKDQIRNQKKFKVPPSASIGSHQRPQGGREHNLKLLGLPAFSCRLKGAGLRKFMRGPQSYVKHWPCGLFKGIRSLACLLLGFSLSFCWTMASWDLQQPPLYTPPQTFLLNKLI